MQLLTLWISLFLSLSIQADDFIVRDYFDGKVWRLGPFHIRTQEQKILKIEGPLPQSKLNKFKVNPSVYFYPKLDLIPGLVDSHTHLSFLDTSFDSSHDQPTKRVYQNTHEAFQIAHKRLDQALNRGFTAIRDLGGNPVVIKRIRKMVKEAPHLYPNFFSIDSAFAPQSGQCPQRTNCMNSFIKLPLSVEQIKSFFTPSDQSIHNKIFLDNDPYPGALKKSHVIPVLQMAKRLKASLAIHSIKQKDFSWLVPHLFSQVSLEHLNSIDVEALNDRTQEFINSKVRLVPSVYSKSYLKLLKSKNKLPAHWPWDRQNQIQKLNALKKFTSQLCFGSDFYFPNFSPLRDTFYYAIEIMRDMVDESFLRPDQVLAMATSGCNPLFPGSSIGLIKEGSTASFNLVGGDLKRDIKYLHDIRGVIHKGHILRLEDL